MTHLAPGVPRSRRPGFTLMEVSAIMAALALLSGVAAVALVGALRLQRSSADALDRMSAWRDLADQFRADVAGATAAPERAGDDVAGPGCLILTPGARRQTVYRVVGERLFREEIVGEVTYRREVARGAGLTTFEFERADGGRLVTLRLFTMSADGRKRLAATYAAALGGDLQ